MIAEDLGRIFEVGFNIGILTFIQQNKIKHNFGNFYQDNLAKLKFNKISDRISSNANIKFDTLDKDNLTKWVSYFLQKGFLSGLNFFQEYLASFKYELDKVEIIYYQANFCDEYNSFGLNIKSEHELSKDFLSQFKQINQNSELLTIIKKYKEKGEFLKADSLMLLRYGRDWRILCVDLSIFSVKEAEDMKDLDDIEILRKLLLKEINYLHSKSSFSQLNIDTGKDKSNINFNFSESLVNYFSAFKREDKETVKLIQAASYGYSFYQFLTTYSSLLGFSPSELNKITFNLMGYTDRGINSISVTPNNLNILETCQNIYKKQDNNEDIKQARKKVFRNIKHKAKNCFEEGGKFIEKLESNLQLNTINYTEHQEKITGFANSIEQVSDDLINQLKLPSKLDLRNAHAELINKALTNSNPYLFLTGNPGIGKTTAIVNFLINHFDEGFLFFYVSPRTQVNLDAINKFNKVEKKGIFCINTNSNIIKQNGSNKFTVSYTSNIKEGDFIENNVCFINSNNLENLEKNAKFKSYLHQPYEDTFQDKGEKSTGVLNSICTAIGTLIKHEISNNIVATIAIQALKAVGNNSNENTLKHLEKIFDSVYNKRHHNVIPEKMEKLAKKFKHIFIMIDEITGDDSGVEFLEGVKNLLTKYELIKYGINAKIIIADASIVSSEIINEHFKTTNPEPDKIFYRKTNENLTPLWLEEFNFKEKPATLINANSYPAKSLNISYKIFLQTIKFNEDNFFKQKYKADENLRKKLQAKIAEDLINLFHQPNAGQIIIYIQDKARLQELIEYLKEQFPKFNINEEYLEIHANISDKEKEDIHKYSNQVKIIFMTSSASRGLSFPKTKHILVDIPHFCLEKNLMEIIQVIYRGRGSYDENGQEITLDNEDKDLTFYVSETSVYYEDDLDFATNNVQENLLNIIDLLLILKTAIMTRICGSGKIGKNRYMMIPIGGKSVSMAGETYTSKIVSLIQQLKRESNTNPSHQELKETCTQLKQLLAKVDITIKNLDNQKKSSHSFLSLRNSFTEKFNELVTLNLAQLLTFNNLENCHIHGSMLLVPLGKKYINESYLMPLKLEFNEKLLRQLNSIKNNSKYPQNLKTAVHSALELVYKLKAQENQRNYQYLEQNSNRFDRYYAIPLFTFICRDIMQKYFSQNPESEDNKDNINFHDIIKLYLNCLFPISSALPIGIQYEEFPFIVFNSYSLNQIRKKVFTDTQLFNSPELNVLNLILSQE